MWFKESGISRLYLSLWKQKCRNLQNYGRKQNGKVDETSFFKISPLSTATWKWASPIMIVALVAQDNCLTFAKSVSVSLAYSISLHLKALSNFGILQCSVTQTEFAMGIDKQKVSDSTANTKHFFIFFYHRNNSVSSIGASRLKMIGAVKAMCNMNQHIVFKIRLAAVRLTAVIS